MEENLIKLGEILGIPIFRGDNLPEKEIIIKPRDVDEPVFIDTCNEKIIDILKEYKPPAAMIEFILGGNNDISFYKNFIEEYTEYDSNWEKRLEKFTEIYKKLSKEGIIIAGNDGGNPVLEDQITGFKMTQNIMSWDIYDVDDVVKMIVESRNKHRDGK